jgi:uncharacterized protein YecE (DUF72 family)
MTKRWATITPDNFRFAAKFPRSITHEKRLADPEKELRYFFLCHATITPQDIESLATTAAFLDSKGGYEELEELRFIGDRRIDSKRLQRWSEELDKLKNKAKFAIMAANNHYASSGPATANSFRRMLGPKVVWEEMEQKRL